MRVLSVSPRKSECVQGQCYWGQGDTSEDIIPEMSMQAEVRLEHPKSVVHLAASVNDFVGRTGIKFQNQGGRIKNFVHIESEFH